MRSLLLLAGLIVVTAGRPDSRGFTVDSHQSDLFSRILHHLNQPNTEKHRFLARRQTQSSPCKEMSDAAVDFIKLALPVAVKRLAEYRPSLSKLDIAESIRLYTGFDFINDNETREMFYCSLASSVSLTDYKERADVYDINYRMFRFMYDIASSVALTVKDMPTPTNLNGFYFDGLFNLDPEGVTIGEEIAMFALADLMMKSPVRPAEVPVVRATCCNIEEKCAKAQAVVHQLLSVLPQEQIPIVQAATGINPRNSSEINRLTCDIIKAAPAGLRMVYKVLDDEGIVSKSYKFIYPLEQRMIHRLIDNFERDLSSGNTKMDDDATFVMEKALRYLVAVRDSGLMSLPLE